MKKFLCLLLVLTISFGTFVIHAFAEGSGDESSVADNSEPDSSLTESSQPDNSEPDSSLPDSSEPDSSEPDSSLPDSSEPDSSEPEQEYKLEVNKTGEGSFRVDGEGNYKAGETATITITPATGYGVKAITVNGEEFEDFAVNGGKVKIEISEDTSVDIEFAEAVRVIVDCELGGDIITTDKPISTTTSIPGIKRRTFLVLKGENFEMSITRNANQAIDKLTMDGKDVTKQLISGYKYKITEIQEGCTFKITFRETGNTEVDEHIITINIEGKGTVEIKNGEVFEESDTVLVEEGKDLVLIITAKKNWVVKSITDRGNTKKLTGNTYTVKNILEDGVITVIFEDPNAEESKPDDSSEPDVDDKPYITRDDIMGVMGEGELRIDISAKKSIGKDALECLNGLISDGKKVAIGESGKYWWMLPENASFATEGLAEDGINFGVLVNEGDVSQAMKQLIKEKADASSYNNINNVTIERLTATALPEGTTLKVYMGKDFKPGEKLDWLKYSSAEKKFSPMNDSESELAKVDNSGYATVIMPFPEKYGILVNYIGSSSTVSVTWNKNQCTVSMLGDISVSEDGTATNAVLVKSGKDVYITVNLKSGFMINDISSDDYANMQLLSGGKDVTESGGKGVKESITIKLSGISKNGNIVVTTAEAEPNGQTPGNPVPWDIIVLIAVIVIAMVAGGVVFVIKWRQSDDDDDDDDFDYEAEE